MQKTIHTKELENNFKGTILTPDDEVYDKARTVWNAMVDRRPAVIAQCTDTADVVAALNFGRDNKLEIGVRGGGHSVAGHAVPEGGLMIDLCLMHSVRVDADKRRAYVQGGSLLGAVDREAQKHGLATTGGNVSHTGVGGYTLAGGTGWLARQFGLASDNVVSYELVTAKGEVLRVDEKNYPELFWGLKGGGGNFGIVTEFEFQLHPIDGRSFAADLIYSVDSAPSVLRRWVDLIADAPRQATLTAWTGTAGEWPFIPAEFHGKQVVKIGYTWVGDPNEGRALLGILRGDSSPIGETTSEMSYVELQSSDDDTVQEHGLRRYWKGHYFNAFPDEAISAFLARGATEPVSAEEIAYFPSAALFSYGGAIADTPDAATAFSHRDALIEMVILARWRDVAEDEKRMNIARSYATSMEPFSDGVYINTAAVDGQAGAGRAYSSEKLTRLAALKQTYDPENIFHHNANIRPANKPGLEKIRKPNS